MQFQPTPSSLLPSRSHSLPDTVTPTELILVANHTTQREGKERNNFKQVLALVPLLPLLLLYMAHQRVTDQKQIFISRLTSMKLCRGRYLGIDKRGAWCITGGRPPKMFRYFRALRQLLVQSEANICSTTVASTENYSFVLCLTCSKSIVGFPKWGGGGGGRGE